MNAEGEHVAAYNYDTHFKSAFINVEALQFKMRTVLVFVLVILCREKSADAIHFLVSVVELN